MRSEATEFTNGYVFPFEVNQAFQVLVGDFHLVFKSQIRENFSCFKVVVDLVEEIGVSHGCATNHDSVSPDFFDTLFGFLDRTDITICDKWNLGQSLSNLVKSLKVCVTCVHLFTGTAVHSEGRDTCSLSSEGIFHGMKSYFCQDEYGQIAPVYSISAGLDYPGIGPEHAWLHDMGRATYVPVTDDEAVDSFEYLSRMEGIIPAVESAHAVAYARKIAPSLKPDQIIVVNLSGRGDKDVAAIARYRGVEIYE